MTEKRKTDPFDVVGANIKVFNFNNIEREGTREIVPIDEKKILNLTFTCFKDKKTGIWYGLLEGEDFQTKRPLFKRITITGRRMYHLENEGDAMEWAIVSKHPCCLSSFLQRGMPLIKPYDRKKQAVKRLDKIKRGARALDIALNHLKGGELLDFARLLAITPENNDYEVVEQLVAEKAQRDPDLFMEKYTDANKDIFIVINRARAVGLINYKLDQGLTYKGMPLGSSDIAAINYFRENVKMLESIDIESKTISKYEYGTEEPEITIKGSSDDVGPGKPEDGDYGKMKWVELQRHAKGRKINILKMKQPEIIAALKALDAKSDGKAYVSSSAIEENSKGSPEAEEPIDGPSESREAKEDDFTSEDEALLNRTNPEPSDVGENLE